MKNHIYCLFIRCFLGVFITASFSGLIFAQETMDYKLRVEQYHAGYRNVPVTSDTVLAFKMIEVINEKGCDTLIYLIGNDRREDFRMPYDNGIHSEIKSLIVQKVLADSLCVCELLDHLGLYVSDHSIDAEDSNWPIFYALKKSDKAFIIVKRYLLNSKYKFPRSFAKGRRFGEAGWLVRAIFDSMEEEEIKLISEKRMKYFNQFIE